MRFRNNRHYLIAKVILFIIVLALCQPGFPASAAGTAVVAIAAPDQPIRPGQQFAVSITIEPDSPVTGAQLDLSFNPSLVSVSGVTKGNYFSGFNSSFAPGNIDNNTGTITGIAAKLLDPGQTVSTPGILAVINMAAGPGSATCSLSLSNVIVSNADGDPLSISAINGQVVINTETTVPATTTTTTSAGGSESQTIPVTLTGLNSPTDVQLNLLGQTSGLLQLHTNDGIGTIEISAGTYLLDNFDKPLTGLSISKADVLPEAPDGKTLLFGYEFGPDGASFSPDIAITIKYERQILPADSEPANLQVAYWNGSTWEIIAAAVNVDTDTIVFSTSHFTIFAILYPGKITLDGTVTVPIPTTAPAQTTREIPVTTPTLTTTLTTNKASSPITISTGTAIQAPAETTLSTPASAEVLTAEEPPTTADNTPSDIPDFSLSILASLIGGAVYLIILVAIILFRRHRHPHDSGVI
jgi:hypothetical protein